MNSVKSPTSAFVQNGRSKSIPVLASRGLSFSFLGVEAIRVKFDSTLVFATSSSSSLKLILSLRRDNLFSFPFSSLIAKRDDFFGLNHSTTPFTNPPMTFCFRSRSLRWFVFSPRGFGRGRGTSRDPSHNAVEENFLGLEPYVRRGFRFDCDMMRQEGVMLVLMKDDDGDGGGVLIDGMDLFTR